MSESDVPDAVEGPGGPRGPAAWWAGLSRDGRRGIVVSGIVVVLLLVGAVIAFGGGGDDEPEEAAPTSTTEAVTTTTEPETGPVAPLTGLRLEDENAAQRPALAVKIDNLDSDGSMTALPQAGLPAADIVFEEIVEGDITRLVAIFHSQDPGERVGPVRSARTTDLHILPQLGRTLFAWSGGNAGVTAAVAEVDSLIDLGAGRAAAAYRRDDSRRAPHNLYVDAGSLWELAPDEVVPPDPLFLYREDDAVAPDTAEDATGVELTWGGGPSSSPVSWTWDGDLELYRRDQRGRPHLDESDTPIVAQNVVVLMTPYGPSPADHRSPEAHTVGEGEALVFTGGDLIRGRWDRPVAERPAVLTDARGARILLTPGQTWIELPREGEVTVR